MNPKVEAMHKQIEEVQRRNDAYLAAHIPGYDPEKAKAAREKMHNLIARKRAEASSKTTTE